MSKAAEQAEHARKIAGPKTISILRMVGAGLIAAAFAVVLMAASLQASVAERLAEQQISYGEGYGLWRTAQNERSRLVILNQRERKQAADLDEAERNERQALGKWTDAMAPVFGLLVTGPGCGFQVARGESVDDTAALLADLRACVEQESLSARQRQTAAEILAQSNSINQRANEALNARQARVLRQTEHARMLRILKNRPKTDPNALAARVAFMELESFGREIGMIIWLARFPPAVVHILMAFFSGMFGALLITMVLLVYPKNELKLSSGEGRYAARIFLGGMISICVFVMLGGGTAVLGTTEGFGGDNANFLAFCAIGILAGMFSDRVAHWLSARADVFFGNPEDKERQTSESGKDGDESAEDGDGRTTTSEPERASGQSQ